MNLLPERTLGEFSHYRILFTDSNVRLKLFSTRHGSLWELKVLYGRETLQHEVKSLSVDGIYIMHSFQERFVYSSLGKWVLVNRGWVGKVILLWFNFILGLNTSLCSTQNKGEENDLNQE